MYKEIKNGNSSGRVRIQNDKVFWDSNDKNILQIAISEIVVIGEYTNSDGPFFDDWFLAFVTRDEHLQSIPMYAENIDELTQYLSKKFNCDLNSTHFANSTEWKSIIRYPTNLKDKPLFTLELPNNYKSPKTYLSKILSSVVLGNINNVQNIVLTEDVKNELANACR
ncbi:MAG TPA: hypothetical protein VGQ53_11675 [Chitinophagaceae bacterium]|jgi:hypothetical protein|nr:hypothetical protein [Chitinophagaceae bacterium]